MTNERVRANTPALTRRALLTNLPAAGVALTLPDIAAAQTESAILEVLLELESWEGWEASSVVAAKCYAAYRIREALRLELPDPEKARLHLDYQRRSFEDYRRSVWFERDREKSKTMAPPRPSASI